MPPISARHGAAASDRSVGSVGSVGFPFGALPGALFTAAALLLSGCALMTGPGADRTEFFTLEALAQAEGGAPAAAVPRLLVRGVELPVYLQRSKAIAVRRAEGEIGYAGLAWWSEPLDLAIVRVLRENLGRLGVPTAARRDEEHVNELTVRIEQAEGVTDGPGRVEFAVSFELRRNDLPRPMVIRRTFTAGATAWDGRDYAALARALSESVAGLAGAIKSAL